MQCSDWPGLKPRYRTDFESKGISEERAQEAVVPLGRGTRELMPGEGAQMWAGTHLRLQALQTRQVLYQAPESPR